MALPRIRSHGFGFAALLASIALPVTSAAGPTSGGPVATTPPLAWQGLREIRILCLVVSPDLQQRLRLQTELCERVRAIAAEAAPIPVATVGFGDPIILDPQIATLLIHVALQEQDGIDQLILGARPFRAGGPEAATLFGAAPRALAMADDGALPEELDDVLRASLQEILPWGQVR